MFCRKQNGIALILTIVVLAALSAIVYRLSSALVAQRHRQQYIIDYQKAHYACESGLKYALSVAKDIETEYVTRVNEPDFSDLFVMDEDEYKELISQWAEKLNVVIDINNVGKNDFLSKFIQLAGFGESGDGNDFNDMNYENYNDYGYNEPNYVDKLVVRGPYGYAWPYVSEPITFTMGGTTVIVKVEDENAKMPLSWGISGEDETKRESDAAIETFCEWMQMEPNDIEPLKAQLSQIKKIKEFKLVLEPVVTTVTKSQPENEKKTEAKTTSRSSRNRRRIARERRRKASSKRRKEVEIVKKERDPIGHTRDFAKLMHSPIIDIEKLAEPVAESEDRSESALKYLGLWGTQRVNINSAPRHVLEAAFTYGGDAVEIAEEIIKERKAEPFVDIKQLQDRLLQYNDSIEKSKMYMTTESTIFTIRVTAISGVAKVSATAAIKRIDDNIEKIGIISD